MCVCVRARTPFGKQPRWSAGRRCPWSKCYSPIPPPTPRLVPCRGPSATWEGPLPEEGPLPWGHVGLVGRGSPGFSVPWTFPRGSWPCSSGRALMPSSPRGLGPPWPRPAGCLAGGVSPAAGPHRVDSARAQDACGLGGPRLRGEQVLSQRSRPATRAGCASGLGLGGPGGAGLPEPGLVFPLRVPGPRKPPVPGRRGWLPPWLLPTGEPWAADSVVNPPQRALRHLPLALPVSPGVLETQPGTRSPPPRNRLVNPWLGLWMDWRDWEPGFCGLHSGGAGTWSPGCEGGGAGAWIPGSLVPRPQASFTRDACARPGP